MNKYITNLYGHSYQSTAMAAQQMIAGISKQMGYQEISINAYKVTDDNEKEKNKRIEGMLANVLKDSMAIAQMPSWNGIAFDEDFLQKLRKKVDKMVVFVHDFVPLMFENNRYLMKSYISAYNLADLVILPSEKMKEVLYKEGLTSLVMIQSVWDHVSPINFEFEPQLHRKLMFIGNVTRFPFVNEWDSDLPLEVYSDGVVKSKGKVRMLGWKHDEHLLRILREGGIGLVWSENLENQYERVYSEMNASFKFSTYLAAGIPIIVNSGLAKEKFLTQYDIGYVSESLDDAIKYVKMISDSEYNRLINNVKGISSLMREGFFTKQLLIEVQKELYLSDK